MDFRETVQEVQNLVSRHGGWDRVFSAYPDLDQARHKCHGGQSKAVPCPFSKQGKTVFRFYKDWEQNGGGYHNQFGRLGDGIDMVALLENCSKGKAISVILEILGEERSALRGHQQSHYTAAPKKSWEEINKAQLEKNRWIISQVEQGCIYAKDSQVALNYLNSRGLTDYAPETVGFNPSLFMYDKEGNKVNLPGLVFYIVNPDLKAISMHRIFLESDGSDKAKCLENAKMQCSPVAESKGASIHLGEPTICYDQFGHKRVVLAVCEGPETGLAIQNIEGIGVWCGISSTIMEKMYVPEIVTDLLIFADKDRVNQANGQREGTRAAKALADRIATSHPFTRVSIFTPPTDINEGSKSQDWLDELNQFGNAHFPQYLVENNLSTQ
ncbi:toprim domain-containing protein (plasmid) [Vibrio sp. SS-MA-C1-2]|uniref:DUF7146 domain-containing protein n=1 Tax=Vibrio sp. SS-MA-C1-2 TaxID=2908646 RepID=UPI001F34C694|nr:toprim domain-containing protein [Vibrio sp. SS-MA-C1-2]UJF20268.1 toprim domain-containing protein [Vibrio sp. SS-MA-C1-2]